MKEKPIDCSKYGVPLCDLKLITMLLDDDTHTTIGSLTEDKVAELDKICVKLNLDDNGWKYYARTRYGDETGLSLRCRFYSKNAKIED